MPVSRREVETQPQLPDEELPRRETLAHVDIQNCGAVGFPKRHDWAPVFLAELAKGASIHRAAKVAGVHETMPYKRRAEDTEFATAWRAMSNIATELLEEEAARRAFHGTLKPVFYKGEKAGYVRHYSDNLLMFILKKRDPSYRDSNNLTIHNNTLNVFDDIDRDTKLIQGEVEDAGTRLIDGEVEPAPGGDVSTDGPPESLDEAQPYNPQEE